MELTGLFLTTRHAGGGAVYNIGDVCMYVGLCLVIIIIMRDY